MTGFFRRLFPRPARRRPVPPFTYWAGTRLRSIDPAAAMASVGVDGSVALHRSLGRAARPPAGATGAKAWCADLDSIVAAADRLLGLGPDCPLGTAERLVLLRDLLLAVDRDDLAAAARLHLTAAAEG